MKSILLSLVAVTFLSSCARFSRQTIKSEPAAIPTQSQPTPQATSRYPAPQGFINDFANVIDAEAEGRLDALVKNLKAKANIEFAIVTLDTTNKEPIFDYSLGMAREWGVGSKESSQGGGMLLLVAVKDRQWRLQVSRALEKELPDEVLKKLGEESVPLYRKSDFAGGIEKYVTLVIKELEKRRNRRIL